MFRPQEVEVLESSIGARSHVLPSSGRGQQGGLCCHIPALGFGHYVEYDLALCEPF